MLFVFIGTCGPSVIKMYRDKKISFDLVNEPSMREDMNDQHSKRSTVPGDYIEKWQKRQRKPYEKKIKITSSLPMEMM